VAARQVFRSRRVLAVDYDWLTEGFDTADLKEMRDRRLAKVWLLRELSGEK